MPQPNDLSRSLLPLAQDRTLIVVIELSGDMKNCTGGDT